MKKLITHIIVAVCLFAGCSKDDAWDIVKTRGAAKTELRELPHFTGLVITNGINVVLRHGERNSATLEGWTNLLPKIKLTVDTAGILNISDENKYNMVRDVGNKTTVFLTCQDKINYIDFIGDGLVRSDGKLETDNLYILSENASGSIHLTLDAASLSVGTNSRNTADMTFTGNCHTTGITNWGIAPIDMRDLLVQYANITHHGTADIHVFIEQQLNVALDGIGDLFYKGNPEISVDRKGKGNVYQIK